MQMQINHEEYWEVMLSVTIEGILDECRNDGDVKEFIYLILSGMGDTASKVLALQSIKYYRDVVSGDNDLKNAVSALRGLLKDAGDLRSLARDLKIKHDEMMVTICYSNAGLYEDNKKYELSYLKHLSIKINNHYLNILTP